PLAAPTGPLPALPVSKTRRSLPSPSDDSEVATSGAPWPAAQPPDGRTATRSVTISGLPTPRPTKARSTPAVPTLYSTAVDTANGSTPSSAIPTPGKAVRKTTSISAFPLPPKGNPRVSSFPPSPLSMSTSLADANGTTKHRDPTKHRSAESGVRKSKTRSSGYGVRSRVSTPGASGSPSLLNGTGDSNLISSSHNSDSLLSIPSPPQSRSSSANESYMTEGTALDDPDDDGAERGRPKSSETVTDSKRSSGAGKDNKGNVIVSVRVRPYAGGGGGGGGNAEGEWMVDGRRSLISYKGREGGDYRYDNVFSPHDNNARVYDNAAKRLVRRVMEGYHGTVFAYGMTGTGKTFSMQGTASSPGVIPLAITDIFSYIRENPTREFLLRVSYLEIYNEKIYDLLSQSTPGQQQEEIKLREDSKRGVYATPLKEEIVQSPNQLLRVIARGDAARRTSSTQFNARSSRSHAVVQIVVESRERTPSHGTYFEKEARRADRILPGGVLVSTLSLIDLAGSEKAADSKERRTEGSHINKSLLTLGTVIARLSGDEEKEDGTTPPPKPQAQPPAPAPAPAPAERDKAGLKHLPYRDSKLTRLLQPALSGNSLVSILCTIQLSPTLSTNTTTNPNNSSSHTGETLNTLKFASRAKNNIVSHAKRNESNPSHPGDAGSRALLDRYRLEIAELRGQLEAQNRAKEEAEAEEEVERDRRVEEELERAERSRHEEQMLEMQLARTALKERISHLNRLILSSKSLGVNSGRFSSASMPLAGRASVYSSAGAGAEPEMARALSSGSITVGVLPAAQVSQMMVSEDLMEVGSPGLNDGLETPGVLMGMEEDADGNAPLAQQNRMLQADLADKNRYIATLEKRLLQARRTSHSRVSMHFSSRAVPPGMEDGPGGWEAVVREKDREIEELRAKLDDQMRMVTALRSAARQRDMVDGSSSKGEAREREGEKEKGGSVTRQSSRASTRSGKPGVHAVSGHRSNPSTASRSSSGIVNFSKTPLSPVAILSPSHRSSDGDSAAAKVNRRRSVDEMTMLLDQMIQEKVESGQVVQGERGSLRVK
ncbi:hypothetical protein BAUCODRAFT_56871, partial [Baudoinia panamericana UAMH 10762]